MVIRDNELVTVVTAVYGMVAVLIMGLLGYTNEASFTVPLMLCF